MSNSILKKNNECGKDNKLDLYKKSNNKFIIKKEVIRLVRLLLDNKAGIKHIFLTL